MESVVDITAFDFVPDHNILQQSDNHSNGDDDEFEFYDSDKDSEYDVNAEEPSSDSEYEAGNLTPPPTPLQDECNLTPPNATSTPVQPKNLTDETNQTSTIVRSRKRKRKVDEWQRNKRSKAYNTGNSYKRNGVVTKREVGERCFCKKKMCEKMSDEERKAVNAAFWGLSDQNKRANYILGHTSTFSKKRAVILPSYNRGENRKYVLPFTNGSKLKVCKKFFLSTLCISDKMVSYNLAKAVNGVKARAVRPSPSNKICDEAKQSVVNHINSYQKVESHYCRSTTFRQYLEAGLNKTKMYSMYQESHFSHPSVKMHFYSKVFDEEFNLGFHKPSKDACDFCDRYTKAKAAGVVTDQMEDENLQHIRRKVKARDEKERDKADHDVMTVTCDFQQVMTAPKFFAGSTYYKQKLNVYNFTVYELPTAEGYCYTWTEAECQRGANEIASCLVKYLKRLDKAGQYSKVIIYSDTCGGQNRNRIICTAISSFLSMAKVIDSVEQKFFESGHSHMECDSMHSAIEASFKQIEVALPSDYLSCMMRARIKKPYHVVEVNHLMIQDFDKLNEQAFKKDAFKGIIKAHHIKYSKERGSDVIISMGNDISEDLSQVMWKKRGGQKMLSNVSNAFNLPCGIDQDKKDDLISMFELAPSKQMYRMYYESLPANN